MNTYINHIRQIRICFRLLLLALSLTITTAAQTPAIPLGSYTAVIPQDVRVGNLTFLSGEYQLTLLAGGRFQLGLNDFIGYSGTYTVSGNQVKFAGPANTDVCGGEGMYQWALTGNRLTLTAVTARVDSCVERLIGLTSAPFFRQDPANKDWRGLGPTGGQFNAVMIHDGKIYVGGGGSNSFLGSTGGGVFISADNGQTWRSTRGIRAHTVFDFGVFNNVLYAGAQSGRMFFSTDSGETWELLLLGIAPTAIVHDFYEYNGRLYVATVGDGVWRLGDSPYKWEKLGTTGLTNQNIWALAGSGNNFYAAGNGGVYLSTDGGATWAFVNNGLNSRQVGAVYKANGVIYAGTTRGVMISRDEGQTWTQTTAPLGESYSFLPFDGKHYVGFSGGVAYTADQGQTWTVLPASSGLPVGIVFRLLNVGNVLYATVNSATVGGVYRSTDGGQSWTAGINGLTNRNVFDLAATSTALFAATTGGGVFRSMDGGQTWTAVNNGLPSLIVVGLAAVKDTVVAAVIGNTLYRTADNGQTWRQPESGVLPVGTGWLIDATGGNLYASHFQASGVIRSTDEGRTWQYVNAGFDARWGIRWFADGGTLYVGTPNGVYVSNSLVNRAATVSAASFRPAIADKTIVAAFGSNLATHSATASGLPLAAELAGTTVKVRDSLGVERLAPLFFVSAEQVNYQIPAGTAAALATVTITNDDGIGATGELNITATAPGIFTATSNGMGAALAVDALTGAPPPFNATRANGEPNIISVFGTGLGADATDLDANVNTSVQVTIGGRAATVRYAGRAPGFIGLNQFNITLPTGLAAGTHTLVMTRGGVTSNSVTIAIK